jgi:carbon storage regulator CsrA
MLVLSRRPEEKILLPTVPATIKIIAAHNGVVRLGIEAPKYVPILREELGRPALAAPEPAVPGGSRPLLQHRLNNINLALGVLRLRLGDGDQETREALRGVERELELLRRCLTGRCPELEETAAPVI